MILPEHKMCPFSRGERPCLGILCAWFCNIDGGVCAVVKAPEYLGALVKTLEAKAESVQPVEAQPAKRTRARAVPPS